MAEEMSQSREIIAGRTLGHLALLLLVLGMGLRLGLLACFHVDSGRSFAQIVAAHDGAEYVAYAKALATGDLPSVPVEARRHDAGWPLLMSAFSWTGKPGITALVLLLACLLVSVLVGSEILIAHGGLGPRDALVWAGAFLVIYPSQVYYSCFALNEPLFTCLLLGAIAGWLMGRPKGAYLLVALASLVRGPGLLLGLAFLADDLIRGFSWRKLPRATIAVLPYMAWSLITHLEWQETAFSVHRPRLGLPLSGFRDLGQIGAMRVVYVMGSVLLFTASAVVLLREAHRSRWANPLLNVFAMFVAAFLLFHLCLKQLHYIDCDVFTFNYQDRYYVPLLPFALFAWRKSLDWRVVAIGGIASVALSCYWGHNYFVELAQIGR